jgi:predicted dehydrogenase
VSPYPFRSTDIGVVHDLMIHDLDLVLDLVNAPLGSVEAFGVSILGAHEDSVQARLTFQNGCIADLTASRVHPTARRCMHIWSASGTVSVDFGTREVICHQPSEMLRYGSSPLERAKEPGADIEQLKKDMFGTYIRVHKPPVSEGDALTSELASFVDCVLHHREPLVDGNVALEAMVVAERVLERVRSHQWDGDVAGAIGPFLRAADMLKRAG